MTSTVLLNPRSMQDALVSHMNSVKMTLLSMSSRSSVDRAPAREAMGSISVGIQIFLCPMPVSCRLTHLSRDYALFDHQLLLVIDAARKQCFKAHLRKTNHSKYFGWPGGTSGGTLHSVMEICHLSVHSKLRISLKCFACVGFSLLLALEFLIFWRYVSAISAFKGEKIVQACNQSSILYIQIE